MFDFYTPRYHIVGGLLRLNKGGAMSWIIAVLVTSLLFVLPGTTYPGEGENLIDKEIQRRLAMGDKPNRLCFLMYRGCRNFLET